MWVNQVVQLRNADPSTHWLIPSRRSAAVNIGQPKTGTITARRFTAPEMAIPLLDSLHPWKSGYLFVFGHPFFNVTHRSGVFRLGGLPAGTTVVEAWHEFLGTRQQTVTIEHGELIKIQFTF